MLFLLSSCHLLLLSNQNQSICISYPNQVYDKQRKKHFSVVICVCCIMSYSEIFLSEGGVFIFYFYLFISIYLHSCTVYQHANLSQPIHKKKYQKYM